MYTLDKKQIGSIIELVQKFPTEDECYELLEKIHWNGKVVSPYDKNSKVYKCKDHKYRCKKTGKYFNVKTNTATAQEREIQYFLPSSTAVTWKFFII